MDGRPFAQVLLVLFFTYMGLVIGAARGEWFEPARVVAAFRDSSRLHQYKILDTSVIIDGRIADVCETGFLEGTLVIPQFVLRELQQVADSSDSLKRNRGRRGLDILQKVQKMTGVHVQIVETDFPEIREVDLKLIELARRMSGKIVTNDFNLNKVAQLRGVAVLNINELANALKPVVLPGEVMRVFILKEGKEAGQGVAYLDDGTMVVVDQGKRALGRTIEVTVTSVLQTTAGKMIFCRWPEAGQATGDDSGRLPRLGDRRDARPRDVRLPDRREGERRDGVPTPGERTGGIVPIPPHAVPGMGEKTAAPEAGLEGAAPAAPADGLREAPALVVERAAAAAQPKAE
jgi:rRNA-processing protein FCF1